MIKKIADVVDGDILAGGHGLVAKRVGDTVQVWTPSGVLLGEIVGGGVIDIELAD